MTRPPRRTVDYSTQSTLRIGRDDGILVEVIEGLTLDDQVVVGYTGSLQDGEPVDAAPAEGIEKAK